MCNVDESRMSLGDAFTNVCFLDHDLDPCNQLLLGFSGLSCVS